MKTPLRVLIVEDSEDDAMLLLRHLRDGGGYDLTFKRVDTAEAMISALEKQTWDIVISDYFMPRFSGSSALNLLKKMGLDLPFIIVSGKVGEKTAVEVMKAGAHDYIMKDNLLRLLPAIRRELLEAEIRRERKRAEDSLRASEARNRALLEGSPVCTKIVDLNLQLQFMSAAGQKMLCIDDINAFYGRPYVDIYCEPHRTLVIKHLEQAKAGEVTSLEAPANDMQGREGWYYTTFVPVRDSDGQVDYIIATSIDITERKLAEEELRQAHEELQRAYDVLGRAQASAIASDKLAAVGRLTAGVSHEIMNPLNVIILRLYMMLNNPATPPEEIPQLKTMEEQANRITKITQDLLSFSRQRPPERRQIELNETVKRTLGLLEYDLVKDNITLEMEFAEQCPPLLADEDQLQQVILNLLSNARDAVPDGGKLVLSTGTVINNGQSFAEFRVEDSGEGIALENLDKIFEPFFTTKPEGKGTGMGLSICKGIIEAHGGSIWAESVVGQGTTFIVQLPLEHKEEITT